MAQTIYRRFLANDTTAWPLNREEVGENLASGTYKIPEGWYVVNGLPREFFEPDRSGKLEKGLFVMDRGYCSICGGHTSNLIDLPSELIKDHIPVFPETWKILSVCNRRKLCVISNKPLEKIISEYKDDKAKEKRAQREINKQNDIGGESTGGVDQEPSATGETNGTMPVRSNGLVGTGEEWEGNSLEMPKVSPGS